MKKNSEGYLCWLHEVFAVEELGSPVQRASSEQPVDSCAEPAGRYLAFSWSAPNDVQKFIELLPVVKQRALELRKWADELEVEQWLIRAASREAEACNVEYLAIDRQCTTPNDGRADILGYYWQCGGRRRGQSVPLAIIEVKHLLNNEIQKVHDQLWRYRGWAQGNLDLIAEELQVIAQQKAKLGLIRDEFATLRVNTDPRTIRYVIVLVDHNPFSTLRPLLTENLRQMSQKGDAEAAFIDQLELFHLGFGMWRSYGKSGRELLDL